MADLDVPPQVPQSKTRDLDKLLLRHGNLVDPGFVPGPGVNAFYPSIRFFGYIPYRFCGFSELSLFLYTAEG